MALTLRPPSRWIVVLACCALGICAASAVGPSVGRFYDDYRVLKADEDTRGQLHTYDLCRVVTRAARSPSTAGVLRGRFAANELARRPPPSWDTERGNASHYGNIVMGRIALEQGDLAAARCHLLEAARTSGSPQLENYGPDMTLAQEMLERGESAAVLQYFSDCERFWLNRETDRLAEWSAAVRQGQMPDFGWSSGLTTPRKDSR